MSDVAHGGVVGIESELLARFALAKQVPTTIELGLQLGQARMALGVGRLALTGLEQALLFGDHLLDSAPQAGVVHATDHSARVLSTRTTRPA